MVPDSISISTALGYAWKDLGLPEDPNEYLFIVIRIQLMGFETKCNEAYPEGNLANPATGFRDEVQSSIPRR